MLRAADGGGGSGGGRPPVNIEVNFPPGSGASAFAQARAELAALKKETLELQELTGKGFGGSGHGGTVTGGGIGPSHAPRGGGFAPPVFAPGAPAGGGPATPRRKSSVDEAIERADKAIDEFDRAMDRRAARIRQMSMSVGGAAGAIVGAGTGSPVMGGFAGAGLGALGPSGLALGAVLGSAALQTPQGGEFTNGIGGWLDSQTRRQQGAASGGFLYEMGGSLNRMSGGTLGGLATITGMRGLANGLMNFSGYREMGDTARAAEAAEMRRQQSLIWQGGDDARRLAGLSNGFSALDDQVFAGTRTRLSASQGQLALSMSALSETVGGDPQSGYALSGKDRYTVASNGLSQAKQVIQDAEAGHASSMEHWRTVLQIQNQILEKRSQEKAIVEQQVNGRVGQLAGMSKGDLRQLERAYNDATDGDGKLARKNALLLARNGMQDVQGVQDVLNTEVKSVAPNIYAHLQKYVTEVNTKLEASQQSVEDFSEQMAAVQAKSTENVTKIKTDALKAITTIREQLMDALQEMIDTAVANGKVQSGQPVRAPGGD